MDQQELKNVLELHRKWVVGEAGGKRADLSYANLRYANLRSANLRSADLSYADLRSADLSYADLSYANLRSANLRSANLSSANLSYADLSYADLSYADLSYANLRSANLSSADLRSILEDFHKVLAVAKGESIGLYDALIRGKVDGSTYQGDCACLVGTIANIRNENHQKLKINLKPNADRPIEKWFMGIKKGDTPENNSVSAITTEWLKQWLEKEQIAIPRYRLFSSLERPDLFDQEESAP